MNAAPPLVRTVASAADRKAFVDLPYRLNAADPHWIPPLKSEVHGLITPGKNPWFEHAEAAFFLAERDGRAVGRISAQVDRLVLETMGAGTGQWGMFEAEDQPTAQALIARAEQWLRDKGMTRSLGPFSLSIWDEPGLLVKGFDHSPTVMMGHNSPNYEAWVEAAGYRGVKDLLTYELDITVAMPPIVQRIVASGERNERIRIRKVDKSRFDEEAALILGILNDAWSTNWGFIPLTDAEITYAGKKLKPIVYEDLIRVAELDGEPVAFMMTLPDMNELTRDLDGKLLPFGWAKLLWRLRKPKVRTMRVALMGVLKRLQSTRLASQLAFMMIEYTRRGALKRYSASRSEIGWVLDDNAGMRSIADAIESHINRIYRIYEKPL
jgi:GNAT superfamily N-acetyltransferase